MSLKKASLLFLIFIGMGWLSSCNLSKDESSLERIKRDKKIKVGYISYFDITFKDGKTGQAQGFLVDVLYDAIADLNIPKENIEFVETDWQNFSLGLETGKFDVSIAGTFRTPVREKAVNFGRPIFYLGNGAVVKKDDNRFTSIDDFNKDGVVIAVVQGEQGYEYAKKNLTKATLHALGGSDLSIAPLEVKLGKADAALSDQYILRRYCDKNAEVKDALADNPYDVLPICWSVSKKSQDTALINYLNVRIDSMESSGRLNAIMAKYPMIPFAKSK